MSLFLRIINKYYPPSIPVLNFSYLVWVIDRANIYFQFGLLLSLATLIFLYIQKETRIKKIKKSSKSLSDYYLNIVKDIGIAVVSSISIILWLVSFYILIQYGFWNEYIYSLAILNFAYIIVILSRMYSQKETFTIIRKKVTNRIRK